jgi:hypothetical protein
MGLHSWVEPANDLFVSLPQPALLRLGAIPPLFVEAGTQPERTGERDTPIGR